MQISTRDEDFIIDTLELRSELYILNEAFTDPAIVKVMETSRLIESLALFSDLKFKNAKVAITTLTFCN